MKKCGIEKSISYLTRLAHWESPEAWKNAFSKPQLKAVGSQALFEENPALYKVEVET